MTAMLMVCAAMTVLATLCVIVSLYTFEHALDWCRAGAILVAVAGVALMLACVGEWVCG